MIQAFSFSEFEGQTNEWKAQNILFENVALIVGKNSTGKTRLLNVINNYANFIAGKGKINNGRFDFHFAFPNKLRYEVHVLDGIVEMEKISDEAGIVLLDRTKDKGKIFSVTNGKMEEYSPPKSEATINIRRDLKDYPYIEQLVTWGQSVIKIPFSQINPDTIAIPHMKTALSEDINTLPYILEEQKQNTAFKNSVKESMARIGYDLEYFSTKAQAGIPVQNQVLNVVLKEKDLNCETVQSSISAGMYRAFAVIAFLEYMKVVKTKKTILIDDIGEGLDFQRSSNLAKLISEKSNEIDGQIIMTSNDRYLINNIDSKYLCILKRERQTVSAHTSAEKDIQSILESGLTNFDILYNDMI